MTRTLRRPPLLVVALLSMACGVWLGLLRLGWILPWPWPDQLILHGPLMMGGFLGTLIGLERAIWIAKPWAYAAPVCSASGALLLVFGSPGPAGPALITLASGIVTIGFLRVLHRQPSLFAVTMLVGAVTWSIGNVWWWMGAAIYRVVPWWIAFAVLTIGGERLDLNRLLKPTAVVRATFVGAAAVLAAGVLSAANWPTIGARVMGLGFLALVAWLLQNDVARQTIRQPGVTRFMGICLLSGYMWLGIAGILLIVPGATSPGTLYDAVLHAVFVGFVVSMIFGHAPIVFPAVLGIPVPYRSAFYLHLVVLHASVAMRLTGDLVEVLGRYRAWGGLFNALALALFIGNLAGSIMSSRFLNRSA